MPSSAPTNITRWKRRTSSMAVRKRASGDWRDETLLDPFMMDQIHRELAYADSHLPRWRYVPEAALRRRGLS